MASSLPFTLNSTPRLIASTVCPFVHKVTLAAAGKKVELPTSFINLKDKAAWFLELWPKGNVPIVVFADETGKQVILNESQVLIDFIQESYPQGPSLFPPGAIERAHIRITVARYNESSIPLWYKLLMSEDKETAVKLASDYEVELKWLQSRLNEAGPWFSGTSFGSADASILPWLLRLFVLKHYRGYEPSKGLEKLVAYVEKAKASEVVQKTLLLTDQSLTWEEETKQAYSSYGGDVVNYFE